LSWTREWVRFSPNFQHDHFQISEEVDPAIAQKARGKQLQASSTEEAPWKAALKSMMNLHFMLYLSSVIVVGIGAGNVFAFLFWSLQVCFWIIFVNYLHISNWVLAVCYKLRLNLRCFRIIRAVSM
jgi:hypothetical protein